MYQWRAKALDESKSVHFAHVRRHSFALRGPYVNTDITKTCLFKYIENCTSENRKFSDTNSDIFHISVQNIDCEYSLEPPCRSMLLSRNKNNNVCPCKPQFYFIKSGFKGSILYRYVFVMVIKFSIKRQYVHCNRKGFAGIQELYVIFKQKKKKKKKKNNNNNNNIALRRIYYSGVSVKNKRKTLY